VYTSSRCLRRFYSNDSSKKINVEKILSCQNNAKRPDKCVYHVDNLKDYMLLNIGVVVVSVVTLAVGYVFFYGVDLSKPCPAFITIPELEKRRGEPQEGCQPGVTNWRYRIAEWRDWACPLLLVATLGAAGACLALSRRTVSSITLLGCGRRAAVVTCGLSGRPRARTYALCDLYMPHPDQLEQNYKKHLYVRGHYLPLMVEAHAPLMDVRGMAELGVVKDFKEAEPRDYYDLQ